MCSSLASYNITITTLRFLAFHLGWEIHNFSKKSSWWKIDNYNKYYNVKIITTKRIVKIVHLKIPQEDHK